MKRLFWWPSMKKDIALYVAKCQTCALVKAKCQKPGGFLKSLPISEWKFDDISMDFIHGLPRSHKGNGAIWVIVDCLTKMSHFIPNRKDDSVEKLAKLYVDNIVRLYGVLQSIVSDRDGRSTSNDWRLIHQLLGTKLNFSTTFHPQTDGQTERVNRTMEDMLRMCALDFGKREFEDATSTIRLIWERLLIAQDRHAKFYNAKFQNVEFAVGDWVYLKIKPFKGVSRIRRLKKLSLRYVGPFEILERVGEAAYQLALSVELSGLYDVFHISVLRKTVKKPVQVVVADQVSVDSGLTTKVRPIRIEDTKVKQLRNKAIRIVKETLSREWAMSVRWREPPEGILALHEVSLAHHLPKERKHSEIFRVSGGTSVLKPRVSSLVPCGCKIVRGRCQRWEQLDEEEDGGRLSRNEAMREMKCKRTVFPLCQSSPLLILHCPSKHHLTFIKNLLPNSSPSSSSSSSSSNSSTCRALNDPIPSPLTSSFIEQADAGEVFEDRSSFWGAVSLIIGTAVGPGMLGLPSATIRSGPFPSTVSIILSWIYVISSIILVAELSFDAMEEDGVDEVSFTALASRSLGPTFGSFVSIVYACLSFSLLIACVSGIGSLLSQCFHAMNPIIANALFPSFVGIVIGIFPFRVIDFSNRLLCALMLVSISVLVATGLSIGVNNLLSSFAFVSWRPEAILPSIPVTVLTLGFHVITPYICKLLRHSVYQARKAILYGGFVPLTMVLSWNVAVLGLAGGEEGDSKTPLNYSSLSIT
ncbi:hypothetical protein KSP40_PGU015763 [Platanthera guangdongensis]|uniref:Integrase catalytic domain-containing protein n=1 Tax=Platanthera guangdongensis TaxID=2320717 RepID=A0ABR2MX51_9ASPA